MSNRKYVTRINVEVDDRRQTAWMPVAASSIVWNSDAYKFIKNTNNEVWEKLEEVDEKIIDLAEADIELEQEVQEQADRVDEINNKIDATASATNKLLSESQINEKLSKLDATFLGTYDSASKLPTTGIKKNDYAYVQAANSEGKLVITKYQVNDLLAWVSAYEMINTTFTTAEMAAIQSGTTKSIVDTTLAHIANTTVHVTAAEKARWNDYPNRFKTIQTPYTPETSDECAEEFVCLLVQDENGELFGRRNKVTATKVLQASTVEDTDLPVLISGDTVAGDQAKAVKFASGVTINPILNALTAENVIIKNEGVVEGQLGVKELNVINDALVQGDLTVKGKIVNKVGNDYAEYRLGIADAGRCVVETGDGDLVLSTDRLQPAANIVSDTFGFAIGETETHKLPIAVCGRALVYPFEDKNCYKAGDVVCSGPYGTVSIMSREEIINYPDRIVGIVSEIPKYEKWGASEVPVNGRIWIKIR